MNTIHTIRSQNGDHRILEAEIELHQAHQDCPCKPDPIHSRTGGGLVWNHYQLKIPPKKRHPNQTLFDLTREELDPDLQAMMAVDDEPVLWSYLMTLQILRNNPRIAKP